MSQPNLILITTDQQRFDTLSIEGRQACQTPYLDQFCSEGVRFSSAYSAVPSCIAARAAIMTGQSQETHGRLGYRDRVPWEYKTTLPGELQRAGYQTLAIGKMHFYPQRNAMGFERMVLHEGNQCWNDGFVDDYHDFVRHETHGAIHKSDHGLHDNSWVARPWHTQEYLHETNWTVTAAIDALRRRDPTRPFFLWLSFIKPHAPADPPQAYWDMYIDDDLGDVPVGDWVSRDDEAFVTHDVNASRGKLSARNLQRARAGYFGLISHIDAQISRFFNFIQRYLYLNPQDCFTLFTSDHGEMLGDHHYWRKIVAYEGSTHIPLAMRGPASLGLTRGAVRDHIVELRDIMPTFLDVAGVPIPQCVEGQSLLPPARGEQVPWREFLHGEHDCAQGVQYLTDGREKYIWHWKLGEEQLFDLTTDPQECHDLSGRSEHAARLRLWRQRMIDCLEPRGGDVVDRLKNLA